MNSLKLRFSALFARLTVLQRQYLVLAALLLTCSGFLIASVFASVGSASSQSSVAESDTTPSESLSGTPADDTQESTQYSGSNVTATVTPTAKVTTSTATTPTKTPTPTVSGGSNTPSPTSTAAPTATNTQIPTVTIAATATNTPTPEPTPVTSFVSVQVYFYSNGNQYPGQQKHITITRFGTSDVLASGETNDAGQWGAHIGANTEIIVKETASGTSQQLNTGPYGTSQAVTLNIN